jgi:predicted neutral ceramidase superfamily lipid hydrolase
MDVLIVVGLLAGGVAVCWAFQHAVERLNRNCLQTFGYKPIAWERVLAISPAWLFILVAFLADTPANVVVASAFATLVAVGVVWHVARYTSISVAIVATLLLLIIGLFVAIALLALLGKLWGNDSKEQH